MNRHPHANQFHGNHSMGDELLDVGEAHDFYRPLVPPGNAAMGAGTSGFGQRAPSAGGYRAGVPAAAFGHPPPRPSATYYVQRVPAQHQVAYPQPHADYHHSANISQPGIVLDNLEVKSTVLRPAATYARPTLTNGRNSGLPNSILASSLTAGKPKTKKGNGNRKHCNCTKSQCLKLYCECFASGEFCLDCNCKDCHNSLRYEGERSRAIKSSLERNPNAFKPKIGVSTKVGKTADLERLHQKGCHCKKSNCLKNYCECYEAKVPCTDRCKCHSCRNTEDDRTVRFKEKFSAAGLAQLAAAAANETRGSTPSDEEGDGAFNDEPDPKYQPWFYMTDDVIEAATLCMVSYAHEVELKYGELDQEKTEELERGLLMEFSRCIGQIVVSAKVEPEKTEGS
ncbi:CRC domain-containing protein [Aphelenchoides fujianensis]|nr:CRC domain-containing protein [Aphelenchoides fujianensis]